MQTSYFSCHFATQNATFKSQHCVVIGFRELTIRSPPRLHRLGIIFLSGYCTKPLNATSLILFRLTILLRRGINLNLYLEAKAGGWVRGELCSHYYIFLQGFCKIIINQSNIFLDNQHLSNQQFYIFYNCVPYSEKECLASWKDVVSI